MYVPRKCSSSSRIIHAKDHASIQLDFVDVDPNTGRLIPGKSTRYAICGELRRMGESDDCILRLRWFNFQYCLNKLCIHFEYILFVCFVLL
uniref:40S ribosomal protein S21 n=1 Tax=Panagrolaimus sp. ES5 TaxID=591445 RepID=A0AC34F240_9BILA